MKVNTFTRLALGLGATALAFGSIVAPASADPASGTFGTLAGLGSDTTQDVMNAVAAAIGGGKIASYDATNAATTVVTRAGGTAIPRANGSGAGRDLLRVAIGQTEAAAVATFGGPSAQVTTAQAAGQIDFARSSSGASASDVVPDGVLTYIPFAIDAVTYATSATSDLPTNLSKAEVTQIFKGQVDRVAVTGTTRTLVAKGAPDPSGADRVTTISTFIPQAGSGTRSYWLGQVGISETDIAANTYPNLKDKDLSGADVQEHKGAALTSGTAAQNRGTIVPFSIGQWVAQANGKITDHRAGAVVNSVDGVAPTTGSGTAYALNGSFNAYTRKVYNIVPSSLADDDTSAIHQAFVGTSSLVCQQTAVITAYGFGLMTGTGANACGDTSVRAYQPSTSTTTLHPVSGAKAGTATTLSADVTSFGNGGGTVTFEDATGRLLAQGTVAEGAVKGSATWTPATAGSVAVTATFVPALTGVAASVSAPVAVTVAKSSTGTAPITTPGGTTKTKAKAKVKVKVKKATTTKTVLLVTVKSSAKAAGKVTVKEGKKTLGKAKLKGTKAKVTLKGLKAGKHKLVAAFKGSATVKAASSKKTKVTVKKK